MPASDNGLDRSEQDACINDILDHTSFLDRLILGKSEHIPNQDITPVGESIQGILLDDDPPEGDQTPSTETTMTGLVPIASPGTTPTPSSANKLRATRASTRGNPNDYDCTEVVLNGRQLRQLESLACATGLPAGFAHSPPPSHLFPTRPAVLTTQGSQGKI